MRGTIIMWSGDKGVVTAGSQRYDFDISHWQGNTAPASNMTVEIVTTDGRLTGLAPVSEAELAKEKLAAMTGEGSRYAKAIFENVGRDVAIAYGVFFVIAMFVSLISTGGFVDIKITLADLLSGDMARAALPGSSGRGTLLVLLATATVAVPYFWKHKFAPLAFAVPLLFTIMGLWPIYEQHRAQQQAIEAMGEFGQMMGQMSGQMDASMGGPFDALGIGAWLLFATVIFLAFRGAMRFLARG
jgi:tetrahydromethanopterin S-methyltransferase subunit G